MKCEDKEWQHCQKEKLGCGGCFYNDEIKVGEYVRSLVNGKISKVLEVSDLLEEPGIKYYKTGKCTGFCSTENYNVKHSFNIIDLIQVGDYVNGELITDIYYGSRVSSVKSNFSNEDIKSILTKEMLEANTYKLEEK